jgi:hypothetical protein
MKKVADAALCYNNNAVMMMMMMMMVMTVTQYHMKDCN